MNEAETMWVDYELEETQILLDLTDIIVDQLVTEVVQHMNKKGQTKIKL